MLYITMPWMTKVKKYQTCKVKYAAQIMAETGTVTIEVLSQSNPLALIDAILLRSWLCDMWKTGQKFNSCANHVLIFKQLASYMVFTGTGYWTNLFLGGLDHYPKDLHLGPRAWEYCIQRCTESWSDRSMTPDIWMACDIAQQVKRSPCVWGQGQTSHETG